jgi:hypothetical protein
MVKFTVLLVAIDYFSIFAAMNIAYIISVLVALAFAFGCFAAAVVRYRADEATLERWKRNAELWYVYQAEKKAEKKRQKALKKLVKSMRRPSPLPWER